MADNETNVKIGADTSELNAGMKQAEGIVDQSANNINASIKKMSADVNGSIQKMQSEIKGHFEAIGSSIHKVTGVFMAAGAILAGGKAFKEVIEETIKWTGEAVKLSKQLGITTEQASVLNVALAATRNTAETMSAGATMVTRSLRTNEEAFHALGVETRDQNGHYRNTMEVMMEVNAALGKLKIGTDQNVAGMSIYGRRWDEVRGLIRLTEEQMEHAEKRAKELHLIVGPEGVKQMAQYKQTQIDLKEIMHSLEILIGNAVMPALIQLGSWFGAIGPQAVEIFKGALNGIITFFEYVMLGGITLYETLKWVFTALVEGAMTLGSVLVKLFKGDFQGAVAEAKAGWKGIADAGDAAGERIIKAVEKTNDSVAKLWGLKKSDVPASVAPEGDSFDNIKADEKGGAKEDKSRLSTWKSDFEQWKEEQGNYFKDYKQQELEYWESALALTKEGTEEQRQVRHEIFQIKSAMAHEELSVQIQNFKAESEAALRGSQERINIAEREAELIKGKYGEQSKEYAQMLREIERLEREYDADQRKRIDMQAELQRDLASVSIGIERDKLNYLKQIEAISGPQAIEQEKQLVMQEQALEKEALQTKLAAARQGSIEEQQIMNQLEVMQRRHTQTMGQLNLQAATAASAPWRNMIQGIGQSFQNTITGMIMNGTKFGTAMRSLALSVVGTMVSGFVKMGVEWVQQQIMMTLFGQTQEQARAAARAAAAAEEYGVTAATNVALVISDTAVAAMGAASAVAPIPIVGPALAAAAAAEMMGLGMGFAAMASAEGGYDIPSGVNPVTQLHQNEMVLPAEHADTIRSLKGGSAGGGGSPVAVHFNINTIDTKGVKQFFRQNGRSIASAVHSQIRNFNPELKPA